jgi:hypothetical protein
MNLKDAQLTKVDVPTPMMYPDFFTPSPNVRLTPTPDSLALYSSKRLVKSQASETQRELDKAKEEIKKLRLRVKDLEGKLSRVGNAFMTPQGSGGRQSTNE